jgi:diguanylate cyclase (GGDEF)-like protein/PAS domain S-box-containing protein
LLNVGGGQEGPESADISRVIDEMASARFAGRLSAYLYLLSGAMLLLAALVLPVPPGGDTGALLAIAAVAVAFGGLIWILPWQRWPQWTSLLLMLPTFVLIALNNYYGGNEGFRYATFFFVAFAWIGLTQRKWTSVATLPLAAVAYLVPLAVADRWTSWTVSSALYVLPACALVGEAIAWVSARLRRSEAAGRDRERSMRTLFADNPQPMWVWERSTLRFLEVNNAAVAHYGYSREEFLAMRITDIRPPEEVPLLLAALEEPLGITHSGTWKHLLKDGRVIEAEVTSHELRFDGVDAVLLAIQDVTERNRLEGQLRHRAFHDALTQLANRSLFSDRIEHAIARQARAEASVAVVVGDLDGFKTINDSLGHTAGDQLLVAAAQRLQNQLRPGDTAARLGGDEFAVLLEDVADVDEIEALADRLLEVFTEPYAIAGKQLLVTASLGVAVNRPGDGAEELVRNADMAMYLAKSAGKACYRVYEPEMHDAALARLDLEAELRQALRAGEFVVHYQPTVHLESGAVRGFEALVRWDHPERGLLSPAQFIPLAEETGMIVELGRWVLGQACTQTRAWQTAHPDLDLGISVNLSPRQFRDPRLIDDVAAVLVGSGLDAPSLTLEITESVLVDERGPAVDCLHGLKTLGVKVALDDFGTGYSSLGRLRELPIDVLKIDKGFIDGVAHDAESRGLVEAILQMAGTLELDTIAEGVEDAQQAECLQRLGSSLVQGYLYSHPLPATNIPDFLRGRGHSVAVDG